MVQYEHIPEQHKYYCEKCWKEYPTKEEAEKCENQLPSKSELVEEQEWKVGDVIHEWVDNGRDTNYFYVIVEESEPLYHEIRPIAVNVYTLEKEELVPSWTSSVWILNAEESKELWDRITENYIKIMSFKPR